MIKIFMLLLISCVIHLPLSAAESPVRLILTFDTNASASMLEPQLHAASASKSGNAAVLRSFKHLPQLALATLPDGADVERSIAHYQQLPGVKAVERDFKVRKMLTPNDPQFSQQWHLQAGFGINVQPAWDISTGDEQLVVAVIDTGMDYNHPELSGNIWQNSGEIAGDGIDNDGNGYIDDIRGINPADGNVDPMDEDGHGTQIGSIIAAQTDNNLGIAAINWQLQLLPCRFMDVNGDGFVSDAIECLDYILDLKLNRGVNIVATNNSWGAPIFSQALYNAIAAHNAADILFIASAGNSNTSARFYPAGYDLPNVISVSAHNQQGSRASFANFGRDWVHLSAPGVNVLSADLDSGISLVSGTSVAAPVVSGVAALLKAAETSLTMKQVRARLLVSGAPAADSVLAEQTKTGRLLLASGSGQSGAFNCANAVLQRRVKPVTSSLFLATNETVDIKLLSLDCAGNSVATAVTVGDAAMPVSVRDDGLQGDSFATDGIYSGSWTFDGNNTYLTFPDGVVQVSQRIEDYCVLNNVSEIPREECAALVQLYYDTQGQDWTQRDGWLQTATPCSWFGVTCTGGRVTALELDENGLTGVIPANFAQLTELTLLDLSFNVLEGAFPAAFLQLSKLQKLLLWSNALEGTVPAGLGNLTALTELDLSFNRFSGSVPSQLGNLTQLRQLFLEDNIFSGAVPSSFGQLTQLQILWLENNDFSGTLPSSLINLNQLQGFSFAGTSLCPPATAQFGAWLAQLDTLLINEDCPNTAPVVSAGNNQTVNGGASVQLNAVATDAEFNPLTYQWQQVSGTTVALTGAQSLNASFTAPNVSTQTQLVFRFTADDGRTQSSATVTITVQAGSSGGDGGGDGGGSSGGTVAIWGLLGLMLLRRFRLGKCR